MRLWRCLVERGPLFSCPTVGAVGWPSTLQRAPLDSEEVVIYNLGNVHGRLTATERKG
jgi:hypothetical protein